MKRLLCIVGSMNAGGAETFLMKMYRALDKNKYQMDFAVAADGVYDKEIQKYGGQIFKITPKSQGVFNNFLDIMNIVKKNHYHSVLRVSQNSLSALELFAAQLGGAKIRGYRSSNSNTVSGSKKEIFIHKLCICMPKLFSNVRFAPSTEAAEYMFGKGCVERGEAFLLQNGLDLSVFQYSEASRKAIRQELDVPDDVTVYGHIGRFNQQKNHDFLIDVFEKIHQQDGGAVLLLVGVGELMEQTKEKVHRKGLDGSVKFLGLRSDIPAILSAMDVFVFPSFYEGMPNTVIEAQATGLPCVIADTITREANITGLVEYLPLGNAEHWAATAKQAVRTARMDTHKMFYEQHYDIGSQTEAFIEYMFEK